MSSVTWPLDWQYVVSNRWAIINIRLSCTVTEIWSLKYVGVMTLTFSGHVTSSVTWPLTIWFLITWQSFAAIGRRSSAISLEKRKKNEKKRKETYAVKHETAENYRSGRPNKCTVQTRKASTQMCTDKLTVDSFTRENCTGSHSLHRISCQTFYTALSTERFVD